MFNEIYPSLEGIYLQAYCIPPICNPVYQPLANTFYLHFTNVTSVMAICHLNDISLPQTVEPKRLKRHGPPSIKVFWSGIKQEPSCRLSLQSTKRSAFRKSVTIFRDRYLRIWTKPWCNHQFKTCFLR